MMNRFKLSTQQVERLYNQVSRFKDDLIKYLLGGEKCDEILWTVDEDELLRKYFSEPRHCLMKLLVKLKTIERVERRKRFLLLLK